MSDKKQKRTVMLLAGVSASMFAFGFAMVPLYQIFCSVTGFNGAGSGGRVEVVEIDASRIDESRVVTVQFDATLNAGLAWDFGPKVRSLQVIPGKMYSVDYFAENHSPQAVVAQAVPGITPWQATNYFTKAECFCFSQQTLASGERKDMTLRFMVDPALPEDIKVLTLSYTFMDTDRDGLKNHSVAQVD